MTFFSYRKEMCVISENAKRYVIKKWSEAPPPPDTQTLRLTCRYAECTITPTIDHVTGGSLLSGGDIWTILVSAHFDVVAGAHWVQINFFVIWKLDSQSALYTEMNEILIPSKFTYKFTSSFKSTAFCLWGLQFKELLKFTWFLAEIKKWLSEYNEE